MKLGVWNRLAVVATGLSLIIFPLWAMAEQNSQEVEVRVARYQFCEDSSKQAFTAPDATGRLTAYPCQRILDEASGLAGWREWFVGLGITGAVCAIIYGLIWAIAWTAKWIWRGRSVSNPTP